MPDDPPSPVADPALPVLGVPPSDVNALLHAVGAGGTLPTYFDRQLGEALSESKQQWPALWSMTFGGA